VAFSPEIWPKTSKFRRDFAQLRDLIANISGTGQDIVNRKTALQTTDITPHKPQNSNAAIMAASSF